MKWGETQSCDRINFSSVRIELTVETMAVNEMDIYVFYALLIVNPLEWIEMPFLVTCIGHWLESAWEPKCEWILPVIRSDCIQPNERSVRHKSVKSTGFSSSFCYYVNGTSEMSSLLLVAIQFGTWFLAVAYAYAINTLHRVKRIHTRDEPMKWATRMNWRAAPKLYWLYHSNFPHECLLTGIELTGAEAKRQTPSHNRLMPERWRRVDQESIHT